MQIPNIPDVFSKYNIPLDMDVLKSRIKDLKPAEYIRAKRFLEFLENSPKTLDKTT